MSVSGHPLETPGGFLGEWLHELGMSAAEPVFMLTNVDFLTFNDFTRHGYHPVATGREQAILHEAYDVTGVTPRPGDIHRCYLYQTHQITDCALTNNHLVYTGMLTSSPCLPMERRIIATLDPTSGAMVVFVQAVTDATATRNAVMQIVRK